MTAESWAETRKNLEFLVRSYDLEGSSDLRVALTRIDELERALRGRLSAACMCGRCVEARRLLGEKNDD